MKTILNRRSFLLGTSAYAGLLVNPSNHLLMSGKHLLLSGSTGATSGSGVALTSDADEPVAWAFDDYSTGTVVTVGTVQIDNRIADLTMQMTAMAADMGTTNVVQCTQKISFGGFDFGVTKFVIPAARNAVNNTTPVFQAVVAMMPTPGSTPWVYPQAASYEITRDITHPGPFKIRLLRADGSTLYTFQMQDGLPINDPSLSQHRTPTAPLRPFVHCGMSLIYQSAQLLPTAHALHYYPGPTSDSCRDSQAKQAITTTPELPFLDRDVYLTSTAAASGNVLTFSATALANSGVWVGASLSAYTRAGDGVAVNSGVPSGTAISAIGTNTITLTTSGSPTKLTGNALNSGTVFAFGGGAGQINSLNQWWVCPQWSLPAVNTVPLGGDPNNDPYAYAVNNYYSGSGYNIAACRSIGWAYEPGAVCQHDWYTGPGGPRNERSVFPVGYAAYLDQPTGRRLRDASAVGAGDGTLYRDMLESWMQGEFNHAHHWVTNVQTFEGIPDSEGAAGLWAFCHAYYNGSDTIAFVPGGLANQINLKALTSGTAFPESGGVQTLPEDTSGLPPWNSWALDNLHNYHQPMLWTVMFGSPAHLWSGKLRYFANWMAQLGSSQANTDPTDTFLIRSMAWRWLHMTLAWMCGSTHPLGLPQATALSRFQEELETIYASIVVPFNDPTNQTAYFVGLRNLGTPLALYITTTNNLSSGVSETAGNTYAYGSVSPNLHYYIAHALMLMKQSGLFDVLNALVSSPTGVSGTASGLPSNACAQTLSLVIACLDKFAIDYILDSGCLQETFTNCTPEIAYPPGPQVSDIFSDWTGEAAIYGPNATITKPTPYQTYYGCGTGSSEAAWLTVAGAFKERNVGQHWRSQWCDIRQKFFATDYPNARAASALTRYQALYSAWAANVATKGTDLLQTNADFAYRSWQAGFTNAPSYVGAPV